MSSSDSGCCSPVYFLNGDAELEFSTVPDGDLPALLDFNMLPGVDPLATNLGTLTEFCFATVAIEAFCFNGYFNLSKMKEFRTFFSRKELITSLIFFPSKVFESF